jgi:AraC-like DNA-binding protein/quercetin dioxygenase-like cupin family protein
MSRMRQSGRFDPCVPRDSQITTLARDYAAGHVVPLHFHDRDQIVYASGGVMTVRTNEGAWVVPTHRAVWIPAKVSHTITMSGRVAMRTLYLTPRLAGALPRSCCVLNISPLIRELILHACTLHGLNRRKEVQRHLIEVIVDQLESVPTVSLNLPNPTDPRALRVTKLLFSNPADNRTLAEICRVAGTGKRTMERRFQDETGMTRGRWRQQLRLMQGMHLLAEGAKVTHAALESGYSSPSAFISMFRKCWGTTPSRCFEAQPRHK